MKHNPRFSILQGRAVKDTGISDAQFRTLAALGTYTDEEGWCFPALQTLGNDLGKSKQAVGKDVLALKAAGYIQVVPRFDDNGARRSNRYRLIFDLPRQPHVDTPSTSEVDTPSTSEVDVKVSNERPNITLSDEDIKFVNKKVDKILEYARKSKDLWKGRDYFADNHLPYADWYHDTTNQICGKPNRKSWQKCFVMWKDYGLEIKHLQEAYNQDIKWKKVISDPNELTKKAVAIKAMGEINKTSTVSTFPKIGSDGRVINDD